MSELRIFADSDGLYRDAAERIFLAGQRAVTHEGRFALLLSGGQTPRRLYALLGTPEYRDRLDWTRTHLFWGDERCVGPSSAESNFNSARESLLSGINMPPENIHRIKGERDPEEAARSYEDELVSFFGLGRSELPPFDFVILGLGKDGHTLSLFPGTKALEETERLVVANNAPDASLRVTLTLKAIEKAQGAVFLVSGVGKAGALKDIFNGADLPASRVRAKELFWFVDSEAASLLKG